MENPGDGDEELSDEEFRWLLAIVQNIEWTRLNSNVENVLSVTIQIPNLDEALEAKQAFASLRRKLEGLMGPRNDLP